MTDDPREILKAAGAECAELDAYLAIDYEFSDKRYWEITDDAHTAILALALLAAKYEGMLRLAMEEQGGLRPDPDWMICNTADEYIADLGRRWAEL